MADPIIFTDQSPHAPESAGREVTANEIPLVNNVETELVFPVENTLRGTAGTYDAGTNRWTFPPGIYEGYSEIHLEHNSYPALFEGVTIKLHVGAAVRVSEIVLNATFPGRTIAIQKRFVEIITEPLELYTTIEGDIFGTVKVLATSKTRFVKLFDVESGVRIPGFVQQ